METGSRREVDESQQHERDVCPADAEEKARPARLFLRRSATRAFSCRSLRSASTSLNASNRSAQDCLRRSAALTCGNLHRSICSPNGNTTLVATIVRKSTSPSCSSLALNTSSRFCENTRNVDKNFPNWYVMWTAREFRTLMLYETATHR
jgi:hypothetical protein